MRTRRAGRVSKGGRGRILPQQKQQRYRVMYKRVGVCGCGLGGFARGDVWTGGGSAEVGRRRLYLYIYMYVIGSPFFLDLYTTPSLVPLLPTTLYHCPVADALAFRALDVFIYYFSDLFCWSHQNNQSSVPE